MAILKLDLRAAWEYHIMSIPLFLAIAAYSAFAVLDIIFDRDIIERVELFCKKKYMMAILFLLFLIVTCLNYVL